MALTLPAGSRGSNTAGVAVPVSKIGLDYAAEESVHTAHDVTSSVIASAWPFGWVVGGGSVGIRSVQHNGGSHVQNIIPNRQASDAQLVILNAAAQRVDGSVSYPFRKA